MWVAELSREDYDRFNAADVKLEAIRMAPDKYSATEIEQALMSFRRIRDSIEQDYNLDSDRNWYTSNRKVAYVDG